MNESLTIAIPFFNEEEVIANLYNKLNDVLHSLAEDREVHLLLINDGSTDKTEELLDNFFAGLDNCEILKHDQNRNLDGFLKSCIENCKTDLIVFLDSDCTFKPSLIIDMLMLLDENTDIVNGSPYHPSGSVAGVNKARLSLSFFSNYLYKKITKKDVYTFTSILKLYRLESIKVIKLETKGFVAVTELFIKALKNGALHKEFPCTLTIREEGVSKIRIFRSILNHLKFMFQLIK